MWRGNVLWRTSLCSFNVGPDHKFEKSVTFLNEYISLNSYEYTSLNRPINSERS